MTIVWYIFIAKITEYRVGKLFKKILYEYVRNSSKTANKFRIHTKVIENSSYLHSWEKVFAYTYFITI